MFAFFPVFHVGPQNMVSPPLNLIKNCKSFRFQKCCPRRGTGFPLGALPAALSGAQFLQDLLAHRRSTVTAAAAKRAVGHEDGTGAVLEGEKSLRGEGWQVCHLRDDQTLAPDPPLQGGRKG